jgi:glyoxylase-like metal-dependent hydrolase (beta-lactamase superfamily II)
MRIGDYDLYPVETGRFGLDGGAMFGVVPRALWQKHAPPDGRNRISMAARALLLKGNGRIVLVDTGNGLKMPAKLQDIYGMDPTSPSLESSLSGLGVDPEQVTDVILTHLHFDHAGGSTVRAGSSVRPTFANATYYVQKAHWEAALNPTERDRASFMPEDFLPLQEAGQLRLTEGDGEVLPGIRVIVLHGHTTALQAPVITDGIRTLFFCADLVPLVPHLQLPWIMAYDLRPLVTLEEKRGVLSEAVKNKWILFFEHDPAVTAATVSQGEKGPEICEVVDLG